MNTRPLPSPTCLRRATLAALALLAASASALAQDAPPAPDAPKPDAPPPAAPVRIPGGPPPASPTQPPAGGSRETMWPAATAEEWKKPVTLQFQRTWDDALAVAKETGKPLLLCINMDGEIASEHWAGILYRQPETAAAFEPFVLVIASVYRHTPRDHDEHGRRILCPRFGSVTCGEHIAIEPVLYERFLDGTRIAPRHIMVDLSGNEVFDYYYANDTASVFGGIADGVKGWKNDKPPIVRSDRPVLERVASRELTDRMAVEAAYQQGDAEMRRKLLDAAAQHAAAAPTDLLRLAVFGMDTDMAKLARTALTRTDSPNAVGLISDALRVPMDAADRDALIAALDRLGGKSERARWLSVIHQGLSSESSVVDPSKWRSPGGEYAPPPPVERSALEEKRDAADAACKANPEDPSLRLALAEASLDSAREVRQAFQDDPQVVRLTSKLLLEDARLSAAEAGRLGAKDWRVDGFTAIAAYYSGRTDEAYARSEPAAKALPPDDGSWNSMAVLTIFAESRWKRIREFARERKTWPRGWIADLHSTYTVLLKHPLATDAQIVWHYDFLEWLGAKGPMARILDAALDRFPGSAPLHERFRKRVQEDRGTEGIEAGYDARIREKGSTPVLESFAALASVATAESHRRQGNREPALPAYDRAIARYAALAAAAPDRRAECMAAVALAHAAKSRLALEASDLAAALTEILASFEASPGTAGTRDGIGITPGETAQMLAAKLGEAGRAEDKAKLEAAMAKLDPDLLRFDRP